MSAPAVELRRPEGRWHRHRETIWGTTVTPDIRAGDQGLPAERVVQHAVDVAVADMQRVDAVFSPYRPDSLVTALRMGVEEHRLDRQDPAQRALLDVLQRCREGRELTDGCFDPWAVPDGSDPSGCVKTRAAERIADDLAAVAWTVLPGDGAVFTSGTSERAGHVVDPRTGRPAAGARSASVVGPDARLAGVLATGLVVAGRDGARWFSRLDGWSACVADPGPADTGWSAGPERRADG